MEDKALKSIAKGASILLIGAIFGKFLAFLYRIVLSKLGPETYGEISLAISLFSILSVIAILGLDTGVLRYVSIFYREKDHRKIKGTILFSTKIIFLLSMIFSILLFLLSDWINDTFFQSANLSLILKVMAIALPFESLKSIWTNSLKAFQKVEYDIYARVIGEIFLRILLTVLFIKLGLGIFGASIAYAISIIFSCTLLFIFLETKAFSLAKKSIKAIAKRKEILFYSLPLVFNSLTIIIINAADTLILGYFYNPSIVGIYNVAIPIAKLILIIPTALMGVYIPILAVVQNEKKAFEKVYYTITKWIFFINFISLAWLILYSKDLIIRFFTASYVSAEIPLIILAVGYVINSCTYSSRDILLLLNKTKTIFAATVISCVINILLNIILVPAYGMIGAAIATMGSLTILSLILFIKAKKETKINPLRKRIFIGAISITIAAILSKILTKYINLGLGVTDLILSSLILTSIAMITTLSMGIWEKEDKEMLKTILQKINSIRWKK